MKKQKGRKEGRKECTHVESGSKGRSRFGSGSNVVISHVVVGPVESSALQPGNVFSEMA